MDRKVILALAAAFILFLLVILLLTLLQPKNSLTSVNQTSQNKRLAICQNAALEQFGTQPGRSIAYSIALSSCQKLYGTN